jgi:two-component system, NarL family, nitrate/nitrite response regulator NarL
MRVLIIDQFEICRSGFRYVLEDSFEDCIICEANTVSEALICLDNHGSDMVLLTLDNNMQLDTPAGLRLRQFAKNIPVVVVGEATHGRLVKELTKYNIKGFLNRSDSKKMMIAALQLILAGGQYFPPEIHEQSGFENEEIPRSENGNRVVGRLTRRQLEVLGAVAKGKSNKMIALELGISPGTVKVHISNLMKDLQANNRTQAVSIANSLNILGQNY